MTVAEHKPFLRQKSEVSTFNRLYKERNGEVKKSLNPTNSICESITNADVQKMENGNYFCVGHADMTSLNLSLSHFE